MQIFKEGMINFMVSNKKSNDGFMDNEKLYNMIEKLSDKINQIFIQLKNYNGIQEDVNKNSRQIDKLTDHVNKVTKRINKMENEDSGKKKARTNFREWSAYIVAILSSIVSILALTGIIGG